MNKEFIIVGHGLAGCVLAMTFWRRAIPFRWYGASLAGEASMASSGLITPVTGRKYVKSWRIDEFLDSAMDFYAWTEKLLEKKFFFPVEIVRFLSNAEAMAAWKKRINDPDYANYVSEKKLEAFDRVDRPYGVLTGSYRLDTPSWITEVRSFFQNNEVLKILDEPYSMVDTKEEIIIYATGAIDIGISNGLIPNKGEALIVKMNDWKWPAIIKEEVFFIPLLEEHTYWVGSYYEPWPSDPNPSLAGKQMLLQAIEKAYQGSFTILQHLSGIRPTVDDRRPLVGPLPGSTDIYLFNGMGTKGTSLAPFWANHLADHLLEGKKIDKMVDPSRYATQHSG